MCKKSLRVAAGVIFILTFTLIFSSQVFADQVTITGKVTDTYQIVTEDGTVYEVADTDMGNDLLNHVGKTVEATGTIAVEEGHNVITVTSYTLLE
ncbi:MAG: hypothetical protein KKH68_06590 [Proteobacteria bacterium]|nr:hypothetical protein [Pseudomonadota bacterium]